jgi:hypothetical protein
MMAGPYYAANEANKAADFGGFLAAPCQKAAPDTYIEPNISSPMMGSVMRPHGKSAFKRVARRQETVT